MGVFGCLHKARVPQCKNRVFGCLHRGVSLGWLMQKNALGLASWDAPSHRFQQAWLVLTSGAAFGAGSSGLAWPTNKTLPRCPGARVSSHSHPPATAALPLFSRFGVQIGEPALATKARPLLITGMCCMVLVTHIADLNPRLLMVARISDVLLLLL